MNVSGVDIFPIGDPRRKLILHTDRFQRKCSNLEGWLDQLDVVNEDIEFFQLGLVGIELGVVLLELLELIVWILAPEPVILGEALKELVDIVLCSLDRTSQE